MKSHEKEGLINNGGSNSEYSIFPLKFYTWTCKCLSQEGDTY